MSRFAGTHMAWYLASHRSGSPGQHEDPSHDAAERPVDISGRGLSNVSGGGGTLDR